MSDYGIMIDRQTLRMRRVLPAPVEVVWSYLTDSDKRGTWLASGPTPDKVGARVELHFDFSQYTKETVPEKFRGCESGHVQVGRIIACEPPHRLAYTWHEKEGQIPSEVEFLLTAQGDHTLLEITHSRLPDRDYMISVGSGWHTHVDVLTKQLAQETHATFWTDMLMRNDEYEKRIPANDQVVLVIQKHFAHSAERVFDAWLDPASVVRWLFKTPSGKMQASKLDAHVDGEFCITETRDGQDVAHVGRYLEIDRPRRLVFTLSVPLYSPDYDQVSIDIAPRADGCLLTLTHVMKPEWENMRDSTMAGWKMVLEGLQSALD